MKEYVTTGNSRQTGDKCILLNVPKTERRAYARYADGETVGADLEKDVTLALDVIVTSCRTKLERTSNTSIFKYVQTLEMQAQTGRARRDKNGRPVFQDILKAQAQDLFGDALVAVYGNKGKPFSRDVYRAICAQTGRALYRATEKGDAPVNTYKLSSVKGLSADDLTAEHIDSIIDDTAEYIADKLSEFHAQIFIARVNGASFEDIADYFGVTRWSATKNFKATQALLMDSFVTVQNALISALVFSAED